MTRRFPAEPVVHPDPVLPPDPDLETIHTRVYEVRAFWEDAAVDHGTTTPIGSTW